MGDQRVFAAWGGRTAGAVHRSPVRSSSQRLVLCPCKAVRRARCPVFRVSPITWGTQGTPVTYINGVPTPKGLAVISAVSAVEAYALGLRAFTSRLVTCSLRPEDIRSVPRYFSLAGVAYPPAGRPANSLSTREITLGLVRALPTLADWGPRSTTQGSQVWKYPRRRSWQEVMCTGEWALSKRIRLSGAKVPGQSLEVSQA